MAQKSEKKWLKKAKSFGRIIKQIKLREPDLLLVITGGPIAYTRPDGVKVIPLACLKD